MPVSRCKEKFQSLFWFAYTKFISMAVMTTIIPFLKYGMLTVFINSPPIPVSLCKPIFEFLMLIAIYLGNVQSTICKLNKPLGKICDCNLNVEPMPGYKHGFEMFKF